MTADKKHIVILGGGPAGLGAASQLSRKTEVKVTLLEQQVRLGGNAGSFQLDGIWVDYGSHRLHPTCDPVVLADIRQMLGADLLDRPRHGRIRLKERWIHFPLKPLDLGLHLPLSFSLGVAMDTVKKIIPGSKISGQPENFATVMEQGLGQTITRDFYFPYSKKIWGYPPETISAIQARRRVSAGSLRKITQKILNSIPGLKPPGSGRFFYPRHGFGEISAAFARDAEDHGAEIIVNAKVTAIERNVSGSYQVSFDRNGRIEAVEANQVWSTIPITILARMLKPAPPQQVFDATDAIDFRAMILIYLVIGTNQFSEFDAHYFPEAEIPISRLSEPKNYSATNDPNDRTVLCAELPCDFAGDYWQMSDEQLGKIVCDSLDQAGLPLHAPLLSVITRRLRNAYPIYLQGYESHFQLIDDWIDKQEGILTFGRQGLFAHDNTHHALYMAYAAVACLDEDENFNRQKWEAYREIFETHVVED